MDQKEYSSSGAEFFPTGREFSAASQEIQPPPPEITPAATEADRSGSEFHQSTGPDRKAEKKRRRGITPAMLTTAAVVTAAVIISPLSAPLTGNTGSTPVYPDLTLSARSAAYLDEVWDALPAGDPEQLLTLAGDERLRTLAVEEAAPYLETMERDYGLEGHHASYCDYCSGESILLEGFHYNNLYYDGQRANVTTRDMGSSIMYVDYERYQWTDEANAAYLDTGVYLDTSFYRQDYEPDGSGFDGYSVHIYNDTFEGESYEYRHVFYSSGQWVYAEYDGKRFHVLQTGTVYTYYKNVSLSDGTSESHFSTNTEKHTAEGEFAYEIAPSEEARYSFYVKGYLNNGTITIRQTRPDDPGSDYTLRFDVANGVVRRTDDMGIDYDETDGTYRLYVRMKVAGSDSEYAYDLFVSQADSEDALFHTSNWYHVNNDYHMIS